MQSMPFKPTEMRKYKRLYLKREIEGKRLLIYEY